MKYLDFLISCFVSDAPLDQWAVELAAAAIQLVCLNAWAFVLTVAFGQPLVCYIVMAAVTTLFIVCKIGRWTKLADDEQTRAILSNNSEMAFAQAIANPEMARMLIAFHGLGPGHPGGRQYLEKIADNDLEFLQEVGAISGEWRQKIGGALARETVWCGKPPQKFLAFAMASTWQEALAMLQQVQPSEKKYIGSSLYAGFWNHVYELKRRFCIANPEDSHAICEAQPQCNFGDSYLLEIIEQQHSSAQSLARYRPNIAISAARIAPEHALEIARALPGKAVEIASTVPQAFREWSKEKEREE